MDGFADFWPDSPDCMVNLIEYDGVPGDVSGIKVATRFIQFNVRDTDSLSCYTRALAIYNAIVELHAEEEIIDLNPGRWAIITPIQSPLKFSEDEKLRVIFGFNTTIFTRTD